MHDRFARVGARWDALVRRVRHSGSAGSPWPRRGAQGLVGLLVALPAIRMFGLVRRVSEMQHGDYWLMFPSMVHPDGSLEGGNLLVRHNDHPMLVAKAMYGLNLQLFDGSNRTLALVVLFVGVLQVVAIGVLLKRSSLSFGERALVLILSSVLLLSMNGAWNFVRAMSGAAWLTANVLVLAAIVLRQRDRVWMAFVVATLATASYGTGLAVWPALVAVGLVRRPWRSWWKELVPVVGFLVANQVRASQSGLPFEIPFVPSQILRDTARLIGFGVGIDGSAGLLLGRVALVVAVLLVTWAVVRRVEPAAAWVGVAAYGAMSCAFISHGRPNFLGGEPNRYQSLPALFWVGLVVLLVLWCRGAVLALTTAEAPVARRVALSAASAVVVFPLVFASFGAGSAHRRSLEDGRTRQDLGGITMRLGVDDDLGYLLRYGAAPQDVGLLRAAGQYPFSPRWNFDCGLLGERLPVDDLPRNDGGITEGLRQAQLEGGLELKGRVPAVDPPSCILIVGDDQEVIGAGVPEVWLNRLRPSTEDPLFFTAIALDGHRRYQVVVVTTSGRKVVLADPLDAAEVEDPT